MLKWIFQKISGDQQGVRGLSSTIQLRIDSSQPAWACPRKFHNAAHTTPIPRVFRPPYGPAKGAAETQQGSDDWRENKLLDGFESKHYNLCSWNLSSTSAEVCDGSPTFPLWTILPKNPKSFYLRVNKSRNQIKASSILPKNERNAHRILSSECPEWVSFVFWKNQQHHNLLTRFTDL